MKQRIARPHLDERRALVLLAAALETAMQGQRLRHLLHGLLTRRQREEIVQRLRIAQLLHAGYSYRGIEDATRASSKTIAAVDRWLRRGNPTYRRLFPLRHKRRYRSELRLADTALAWPGSTRGQITALFGMDPRQR